MGGGNKKLVVSAHTLNFQEIHQSNNFNQVSSSKSNFMSSIDSTTNSSNNSNLTSSSSSSMHANPVTSAPVNTGTPGSGASSWFSKSTFSKSQQQQSEIYENSDDISDLLRKTNLADGGVENIEYDQHGLVTK